MRSRTGAEADEPCPKRWPLCARSLGLAADTGVKKRDLNGSKCTMEDLHENGTTFGALYHAS